MSAATFTVSGAHSGKTYTAGAGLSGAFAWAAPYGVTREELAELAVGETWRSDYAGTTGIIVARIA